MTATIQAACIAELEAENERLRSEVARLTGRRDQLLATIANISKTTPLAEELQGWEGQRAALIAEVGTLRAGLAEAERTRDAAVAENRTLRRHLATAEHWVQTFDGLTNVMLGVQERLGARLAELRAGIAARDASIDALTERVRLLLTADPWRGRIADVLAEQERLADLAAERGRTIEAMCACNEQALASGGRVVTVLDAGVVR